MTNAEREFLKAVDAYQEWPLQDRVRDAFDVLEQFNQYRNDVLFQPSPLHVADSLSAARDALTQLMKEK